MTQPLDGMDLLFGSGSGATTPVQQGPQALNGMDLLFGDSQPAQQPPKPQGGGIIANTIQAIKGKRDPKFADVPAFDIDRAGAGVIASTAGATLSGANDAAYADIIQESLGNRFLGRTKDANGYEIIDYIDTNGERRRGYVNQPGLDMGDVQRAIGGGLAYLGAGRILGGLFKGAPIGFKALAQGGGAAGTSIGQDIASSAMGSKQGVDPSKALWAGVGAGAFEALPSRAIAPVLGAVGGFAMSDTGEGVEGATIGGAAGATAAALARRLFGMNPGQYYQNGKLTPAGEAAATKAGLDPAQLSQELAKNFAEGYAKTRNASLAAVDASSRASGTGVRLTKGVRDKDYQQMVLEDQMRAGIKGPQAKSVIDDFDRLQQRDIEQAVRGDPATLGGVAPTLNKNWAGRSTQELGDSIRGGVQAARNEARALERKAWEDVKPFQAPEEALAMLPGEVSSGLQSLGIPVNQNTPTALKMVDFLREFRAGKAPQAADEFLPNMAGMNVDQARRILRSMKDDAATATDKAAAGKIYESYNSWIGRAADAGHFPPDVAGAMRAGRQISAEVKGVFEPRQGAMLTPAGKRIGEVIKGAETPEAVVSALFGSGGTSSQLPKGTVEALGNIKQGLAKYAPETGRQTWDDIRLAYWQRITSDASGALLSPGKLATSIKQAREKHGTAWDTLFSPQEQRMIADVMKNVEAASYRPSNFRTNSSGSGFAGAVMLKEVVGKVWKALATNPAISATAGVAVRPVAAGWYKAKADRATGQGIKEIIPSLGGYGGAAGSAAERGR